MKTHTIILFALAVMATALPAQAAEWWFVNVRDDRQPACINVKDMPTALVADMTNVWGKDNVRSFKQPVHDNGEDSGKLLGEILAVVVTTPDGPGQFPFTSNRRACEAAIQRVMAAEFSLTKARQEIAAGTRQSAYKPPAVPWYVISEALGRCVKLSDGFKGVHTPQQLADYYASGGFRFEIKPGASPDIVGLYAPDGLPAFVLVRGADTCKIAMALSAKH